MQKTLSLLGGVMATGTTATFAKELPHILETPSRFIQEAFQLHGIGLNCESIHLSNKESLLDT